LRRPAERAPNQPENFLGKLIVRSFTSVLRVSRIAALNVLKEMQ